MAALSRLKYQFVNDNVLSSSTCLYALCVCCAGVMLAACQPRQELNALVAKPLLRSGSTKLYYFADTDLRLTVPANVVAEEQSSTTRAPSYMFKRAEQPLFTVHLGESSKTPDVFVQHKHAKHISVGRWQGFFDETNKENGNSDGELWVGLRESTWFDRLLDSCRRNLGDLRWKLGILSRKESDNLIGREFDEFLIRDLRFKSLHFFYSDLSKTDRDLVLEMAASVRVQSMRDPVFTSTVDWYKPPPSDFVPSATEPGVPSELIGGVPFLPLHSEAITLLGDADVIELTKEQAEHFTGGYDPDAALQSLIKEKTERLRNWLDHPVTGFRGRELERQKANRQQIIDGLNTEIKKFQEWEHQLKPYLIKAVTLKGASGFDGQFIGEDLLIYQGVRSRHPLPMKRMPVVAFLPKKPNKIYTRVSMY